MDSSRQVPERSAAPGAEPNQTGARWTSLVRSGVFFLLLAAIVGSGYGLCRWFGLSPGWLGGAVAVESGGYRHGSWLLSLRQDTESVLVARRPLLMGATIKEPGQDFVVERRPKAGLPRHTLSRLFQVQDHILNKSLAAGSVLVEDDLMRPEGRLCNDVGPGYRAVTLDLRANPGDALPIPERSRADITFRPKHGDKSQARELLQRITVLELEEVPTRNPDSGPSTWRASLVVMEEQAVKLAVACSEGELWVKEAEPDP